MAKLFRDVPATKETEIKIQIQKLDNGKLCLYRTNSRYIVQLTPIKRFACTNNRQ